MYFLIFKMADGHRYSRYGLFYIRSMRWLSPDIEKRFVKGEQTLHHQAGLYNGVPRDQFIESTWMKKGKGQNGVIGNTQQPQTIATWVHSLNTVVTLQNDLRNMSSEEEKVKTTHKEESKSRLNDDSKDRTSLRRVLAGCIDPLQPDSHSGGQLLNICTGRIATEEVNVWNAVALGRHQMEEFERSWPGSFYNTLSKQVVTQATRKKGQQKEKANFDPEAIYAQALGLLLSDRNFPFQDIMAYELGCFPPAYFKEDGEMRFATAKSTLRKAIGETVSKRALTNPTAIIIDASAFLWTVKWPSKGTLSDVLVEIKKMLVEMLQISDVHWICDRYRDYSTKSASRIMREENMASRPHDIRRSMPIVEKRFILKCSVNKQRFNTLIYESIMADELFLNENTQSHKLIIMHDDTFPQQVKRGRKRLRLDLGSSHEEADTILTKHAVVCSKGPDSNVRVISDDTDVFALLCYHYQKEGITTAMAMVSPVDGRVAYDIKATVQNNSLLVPKILAIHSLTGCDTVPATYGIGKPKAITAASKHPLTKIGMSDSTTEEIEEEAKNFMVTCYGSKPCHTMTECRKKMWGIKTGKTASSAPKLCSLPPTTEAFRLNVLRAHLQLSHWYAALETNPPDLDPINFGFEADERNKVLNPLPLPSEVETAPDFVLRLLKCGCESSQPCKGGNCKCYNRQRPCTMFCTCSGGEDCKNPFKKPVVADESDSEEEDN